MQCQVHFLDFILALSSLGLTAVRNRYNQYWRNRFLARLMPMDIKLVT